MAGKASETSLRAKIASLGEGDTIFLPDRYEGSKPTLMERSVHNVIAKDKTLSSRRFTTERVVATKTAPPRALQILQIQRHAVIPDGA